ncbi:three-Cys-motif partner protein TcmP [Janthinobacterium sp. TND4EL3]|uniref:three-Cys-motif partner protein TcmP n=1 Tax=Janthinobacterium sp. TND4EL3 TaxID=1907311 RepID=UPI0009F96E9A|nr:three-Cys-motif partner protein TcmP [Janthinobacterium sp. TND4EL3]
MTAHSFGGPWTMIKLDLLARYLAFFNTALQHRPSPEQPFTRIYIDAFAGTGECDINMGDGLRSTIAGSAKIALDTAPAFDRLHLIDFNPKHVAELRGLVASPGDIDRVSIYHQDANEALNEIIQKTQWRSTRGVLFLDPYGMTVRWDTLQKVAATKALDVWYLFPLSAVYRQAAIDFNKVDEGKAAALDSVLGTTEWRTAFYSDSQQESFLDDGKSSARRTAGPAEITSFVHARLCEIFKGWVSAPILLPERGGPPMFALFFAVSNPAEPAVKLSKKAADHLFDMLKNQRIGKTSSGVALPSQGDFF